MNQKPNYGLWLLIAGIVLYLVSPIDLAPDVVPGLGWIDDLIVLFFGGRKALRMAHQNEDAPPPSGMKAA